MPRAQGCAGAACINFARYMWMNGMRGRRDAHDCRDAGGRATQEQLPRSGVYQFCTLYVDERYAAGAGMRTTAGMQEVEPRRSSCRGAACVSPLAGYYILIWSKRQIRSQPDPVHGDRE